MPEITLKNFVPHQKVTVHFNIEAVQDLVSMHGMSVEKAVKAVLAPALDEISKQIADQLTDEYKSRQ